MDENFDWQTEESVDWDELPPISSQSARPERRLLPRRGWWLLLAGLLLLSGWLAWQQVTARIAEAEAEATADLLASHDLLLQASAAQDVDVARSLLSGRDPAWTAVQSDLVETGLWLERPLLGLTYQGAPTTAVSVTLSADLFTAELVYEAVYQTETAEPVTLQQTAVYRRGADRWLYAPLEAGYWGEWEEQEYPRLTLRYRQQEAELIRRLGRDLSQAVTDLCLRVEGMICPADFRVRVQLDPQPDSLLLLETAVLPHHELAYHYRLPAPSLTGRPLDEVSYQALSRGYATWLLGGVVADQVGYTCCRQATIFRVLLDYQLSQIGLMVWPVDDVFYEQTLAENEKWQLHALVGAWSGYEAVPVTTTAGWQAYLLVDYLLQNRHGESQPAAALQQTLLTSDHVYAWLAEHSSYEQGVGVGGLQDFEQKLWFYAYVQTLAQAAEPPTPLPEQDLLFACGPAGGQIHLSANRLLRYDLAADRWHWETSFQGFPILGAGPGADGVLLNSLEDASDGLRVDWWRNGRTIPLTRPDDNVLTLGEWSPNGRFLTTYRPGETAVSRLLLDLDDCPAAGCQLHEVPGDIRWSPDGRRSLIWIPPDQSTPFTAGLHIAGPGGLLLPGDAAGQPLLAAETLKAVRNPFWVDANTFGYVMGDETANQTVMLVENEASRPLVTLELLAEYLPAPIPLPYLSLAYVAPSPFEADHYFLLVYSFLEDGLHLLRYEANTGTVTRLTGFVTYGRRYGALPNVTSGSRYLTLFDNVRAADDQGTARLFVFDLQEQTSYLYRTRSAAGWPTERYNWANDESWLAVLLGESYLLLAVPHLGYTQIVTHEALATCHTVVWVNR
jgi:hypothetical protein